jgi:hypothetical protein
MGGKKAILVWMQFWEEAEAQFWEAEADVWPQ